MDRIMMHPFFEMSLDEQQRRISTAALASPGVYFLLRMVHLTTKIKFPVTGPNEVLFIDSIMAGMMCYTCSHLRFIQYCGRMIILVFIRLFCLIFLFCSMYMYPKWYHVHTRAFDHSICWGLIFIHIVCTTICLTMSITIFIQEQVYNFYNWNSLKTYFRQNRAQQRRPPGYQDAISHTALPPSYEEALASRPPGYSPPVISPTPSSIHMSECSVHYDRYQNDAEEENETMF